MNSDDLNSDGRNFREVMLLIRRRAWIVVVSAAVVGVVAFAYSKSQVEQYTATASVLFNNSQLGAQVAGLSVVNSSSGTTQQDTNAQLLKLGDMAHRTADVVGHGLTGRDVTNSLSIQEVGDTDIVTVSATQLSRQLAADVANTYVSIFVEEQQASSRSSYRSALKLLNRQLAAMTPAEREDAAGASLEARVQSLGVLADLRYPTVEIAQRAKLPTAPSSPKVIRNVALGVVLGLMFGFVVALGLERLGGVLRDPSEIEDAFGEPVLCVVPESSQLAGVSRKRRSGRSSLKGPALDAFHMLRARLRYYNVDSELRVILVASAVNGEGKTTVALNLSIAFASNGARVLLIDCDMRRPSVAAATGVLSQLREGIAEVLVRETALSAAVTTFELEEPSEDGGSRTLDVLHVREPVPPNPTELLESDALGDLLTQARSMYDVIVIDSPPLGAVPDALPLTYKADGVLLVMRVGVSRLPVVDRTRRILLDVQAPLLGVVVNGIKPRDIRRYGYSYGYGAVNLTRVSAASPAPKPDPVRDPSHA